MEDEQLYTPLGDEDLNYSDLNSSSSLHFEFLTGAAGTGKTFEVRKRIRDNRSYGILAATTGIAATNLGDGVTTINSLLQYFDTASLADRYMSGKLARRIKKLWDKEGVRNIILDEVSMLDGRQLEMIVNTLRELEENDEARIGLILTGDFCQLAPVKAPWAFETMVDGVTIPSPTWEQFFAPKVTRLEKIWRQDNPSFLTSLNAFRKGNGKLGAQALLASSVSLESSLDNDFPGSTIVAKNDQVDRFNNLRLSKISGSPFTLSSYRWGATPSITNQWNSIPEKITLKDGALVMILSNNPPFFSYVNGDLATVNHYDKDKRALSLTLRRSGNEILLSPLTRKEYTKETPEYLKGVRPKPRSRKEASLIDPSNLSYWDDDADSWVIGEVCYYPVRLGWATTVHKSQGLTLDSAQIDIREHFFGTPAMLYVALSRCRTPEGLRIIGTPELLASRCKVDPKVLPWL